MPDSQHTSKHTFAGIILILTSAACFGSMALFAKLAYADGVSRSSLLLLRFGIAALMVLPIVLLQKGRVPERKHFIGFCIMGGVLYTLQAQSYFGALQYASSGLVALLLYTFPVMVTLITAALGWEKLTLKRVIPLGIALLGTLLTLDGQLGGSPLGIMLGMGAAVAYSVYIVMGSRLKGDPMVGTLIILTTAFMTNSVFAFREGLHLPNTAQGWWPVLAIAAICTVLAVSTFFMGMRHVGPSQASILSTFEPVVTITLGALFLNEHFSLQQGAGGVMVLFAVVMLARSTHKPKPGIQKK
ncbi:DMT family transporter [Leeia oryzae]|uniref:DMT family transporter n=1 Tax=Leeia oryzae TaxID=356662 RepID=UPI00037E3A99|nr:DMT family transporter [Leeia oryzae]